ncbi:hypothetical protein ACF0H5_007864 [Mactra antiquata]
MLKHRVTNTSQKSGTRSRSGSRHEDARNISEPMVSSLPAESPYFNSHERSQSQDKGLRRRVSLKERRLSSSQRRSLVLDGDCVDASVKNFHRLSLSEECIPPGAALSASPMRGNRKPSMERIGRVMSASPIHMPRTSPPSSPSTLCASTSFSDIVMFEQFREGVTEQDLLQVETFYRSHMSDVYVCGCLVNLFLGSVKSVLNKDLWSFTYTGIPLLLLDSGEHLRERKLSIILAEKGTGFTLWRDVFDDKTGYKTPNTNFHTLHTSKDHSKLVGLSFDDAKAAAEFYSHIKRLTFDPDDELLLPENSPKRRSIRDRKRRFRLPRKSEISNPCCFVHVTKLEPEVLGVEGELTVKNNDTVEISAPFNFQHVTANVEGIYESINTVSDKENSDKMVKSAENVEPPVNAPKS